MPSMTISAKQIVSIAAEVFGSSTEVESCSEILPSSECGIPKVCGCNANQSFRVRLRGEPQEYVFRFPRGHRDDLYEKERTNYRLVAANTDIPVPRVHRIDRSKRLVPVGYMVMDFMAGDEATFLSHPQNPRTDQQEKDEIQEKTGYCYAQVHNISREASSPRSAIDRLLYNLQQLENVVKDGPFRVSLTKIDQCRAVVEGDGDLLFEPESLCVGDSEFHFEKIDGEWNVAFVCDMEWVGFDDPCQDLFMLACAPRRLWGFDRPFALDEQELATRACMRGYEQLREIDYARLARMALYKQLGAMCSCLDQVYRPEKRAFMKSREQTYVNLVAAVAGLGLD
ncbi:MAG TPA: aminoglycoside phosphotransferase family protein [Candidatus Hydrogenedentes bacterium]|nr:aminoglycoside phosphotransferase family protein [Candidatus Hydrogenedentota bacterium]HIJ73241.1 aminoglycoside phosphotransferase family protein [Candidatus Hydrogenedentota bacterium]